MVKLLSNMWFWSPIEIANLCLWCRKFCRGAHWAENLHHNRHQLGFVVKLFKVMRYRHTIKDQNMCLRFWKFQPSVTFRSRELSRDQWYSDTVECLGHLQRSGFWSIQKTKIPSKVFRNWIWHHRLWCGWTMGKWWVKKYFLALYILKDNIAAESWQIWFLMPQMDANVME